MLKSFVYISRRIISFLLTAIVIVLNARHSDKTRERRWQLSEALVIGAGTVELAGHGLSGHPGGVLLFICVVVIISAVSRQTGSAHQRALADVTQSLAF